MTVRLGRPLARGFFRGDTVSVARALLGARLVHVSIDGTTVGRTVEVVEVQLPCRPPATVSRAQAARSGARQRFLDDGIPRAAGFAAPAPFGRNRAAGLAGILGGSLGHNNPALPAK